MFAKVNVTRGPVVFGVRRLDGAFVFFERQRPDQLVPLHSPDPVAAALGSDTL